MQSPDIMMLFVKNGLFGVGLVSFKCDVLPTCHDILLPGDTERNPLVIVNNGTGHCPSMLLSFDNGGCCSCA